jgi:hypothetical protein
VIQSSSTILKDVVGEIVWNKKCKQIFFRFATVSEFPRFYVEVAFSVVIVHFYKMETISFDMYRLIYSCSMNERKKENSAICSIFQSSLQSTSF